MVLSNDEQLLARCSIVTTADIAHAAIADIQPFHDAEAKRPGALNDAATHG